MGVAIDKVDQFEALLQPNLDTAYRVALRMAGDADQASDIVQDAVVSALNGFEGFAPGTNFRAWFLRILTNAYLQARRKSSGRETVNLEDAPDLYLFVQAKRNGLFDRTEDPAQDLADKIAVEHVAQAIDGLPEEYRITLSLYLMNDMAYEEIAQVVGCPLGTVRSRIHRGRNILQKELGHLLEGGVA